MTARFFTFIVLLLCTCCTPLYVPNARNTPLFSGKKEFQASAAIGMGGNVQAAYALTDHIGITGNLLYANSKPQKKFYRTHSYAEVGAGYYQNFKKLSIEIFAGIGKGKGRAVDSIYYVLQPDILYDANASYDKFFIQPDIGMKNHKNFEWSFSPRLGSVNFTDLNVMMGSENKLVEKRRYFVFEPSFNININLSKQKYFLMLQGGRNFVSGHKQEVDFNIQTFHGIVGLHIKFKN
jgi:hypothetical protein